MRSAHSFSQAALAGPLQTPIPSNPQPPQPPQPQQAANLLLGEHGAVKIADFGVARIIEGAGVMTAETGTYRCAAHGCGCGRAVSGQLFVFPFVYAPRCAALARSPCARPSPFFLLPFFDIPLKPSPPKPHPPPRDSWMAPEVIEHKPYDAKADVRLGAVIAAGAGWDGGVGWGGVGVLLSRSYECPARPPLPNLTTPPPKKKTQTHPRQVFSFAVVLWELLTCRVPYSDMTPLQAAVRACVRFRD